MALSVTVFAKTVFGNKRVVMGEVAFDSSYPTGGEAITTAALTDNYFRQGIEDSALTIFFPTKGYTFDYSGSTGKILAYSASATEVSNATDLSSLNHVPFIAIGI